MGWSCLLLCAKPGHATLRRSQFYITFKPTPNLDKKHTVFGKLVGGEDVLDTLEKLPRKDGTERPVKPVKITEVAMCVPDSHLRCPSLRRLHSYQDPFEDYKVRLAKKLAKKAGAQNSDSTRSTTKKELGDGMNWFGVKLGAESVIDMAEGSGLSGVGKYLNLKRPAQNAAVEHPKKRKLGFGEFDNF